MAIETVDNATVYRFIKKLSTPFNKWRAFKHGIIDSDGNILKSRDDLTSRNERDSFTNFDLLVLNMKKTIAKLPGGQSRLASYAAALYLIKEHDLLDNDADISEDVIEPVIEGMTHYFNEIDENLMNEDVPTNHTSTSSITELGSENIGDDMLFKVSKVSSIKHKRKTEKDKESLKNESR